MITKLASWTNHTLELQGQMNSSPWKLNLNRFITKTL